MIDPTAMSEPDARPRVAVIYHMFPHYRAPVMRALARSRRYAFSFWGGVREIEGIRPFTGDDLVTVRPLSFWRVGPIGVFNGLWKPMLARDVDAVILLGNPRFIQTWLAAVTGRLLGKKVLFWAHGWLRPYGPVKGLSRRLYFGLADAVLVYADRARDLAGREGFQSARVRPIYNSLDWDAAETHYAAIEAVGQAALRAELAYPADRPVLICTARLTPLCRFDLLIDAAARLAAKGRPVRLVLVGDGPMRQALEAQAQAAGVDAHFTGALYDEAILSRLIYAADMTVSPGKVGLTAMHSLMYGTPVVTHADLDHQMPEVEAVIEGRTGALFRRDDADDLVRAIERVLDAPAPRQDVRDACRAVIEARYTPAAQTRLIEDALDAVGTKRR